VSQDPKGLTIRRIATFRVWENSYHDHTSPLLFDQYYHIFNRGNNRENIFIEERNYRYFLELYAHHINSIADTYAYCLLHNHFHLLVRIKSKAEIHAYRDLEAQKVSSPSLQFGNLFNAYTKAINQAYQRTGSLFQSLLDG